MMYVPVPPREPVPVDADGRICVDLPCARCGYNLRGLHPAGRCPECGLPASASARGPFLEHADPQWVAGLARGWGWIRASFRIAFFTLPLLALFYLPMVYRAGIALRPYAGAIALIPLAALLTCMGAGFTGVWIFTTPHAPAGDSSRPERLRRIARVSVAIAACSAAPLAMAAMWYGPWLHTLVLLESSILAGVCVWSAGGYARHLALRLPDANLASQTAILRAGWTFCAGLLLASVLGEYAGQAVRGAVWRPLHALDLAPCIGCLYPIALVVLSLWSHGVSTTFRTSLEQAAAQALKNWPSAATSQADSTPKTGSQ